ncbi:MAG: putative sulfate exporter family transporter, partial [Gallionella sp.]
FAVFAVTVWYWTGRDETDSAGKKKSLGTLLVEKFPVFVIGFMVMVFLTSMGAFGDVGIKGGPPPSETIKMLRMVMQWVFGLGLIGLGGFIDFKELREAGGTPLKLGLIVGSTKYILALIVVLLIKDSLVAI